MDHNALLYGNPYSFQTTVTTANFVRLFGVSSPRWVAPSSLLLRAQSYQRFPLLKLKYCPECRFAQFCLPGSFNFISPILQYTVFEMMNFVMLFCDLWVDWVFSIK